MSEVEAPPPEEGPVMEKPVTEKSSRSYGFFPLILGVSFSAILGAVVAYGLLMRGKTLPEDRLPLLEAEGPLKIIPDGPKITPEPHRDSTLFGILDPSNDANNNVERLSRPTEKPNLKRRLPQPPRNLDLPEKTRTPDDTRPAVRTPTVTAPAVQTPQTLTARSGWYVQIAAFRQENTLQTHWKKLQARLPDLLTTQNHISHKIDVEGKGIFYRLMVGPHTQREGADSFCLQLKQRDQDCLVRQLNF